MELFDSETLLVQSNDDKIILTTHRIRMQSTDWGSEYSNTLFLEDISSIEVKYSSLFLALVLGIISIAGGLFWSQQSNITLFNAATLGGGLLVLVYLLSKRHIVSITPNGGRPINFEIGVMGQEAVNDFIHKVQLAKMARKQALM